MFARGNPFIVTYSPRTSDRGSKVPQELHLNGFIFIFLNIISI